MNNLNYVPRTSQLLGCDPEFFFKLGKKVIGSEKVFKTGPLEVYRNGYDKKEWSKFIIDGVQAELNPPAMTCRANLANEIRKCFETLKSQIAKVDQNIQVDFSRTVKVTKSELSTLDEKNQRFGCMPSFSAYGESMTRLSEVDPLVYLNRSAGGHIHVGVTNTIMKKNLKDNPNQLVQLFDMIIGNTCVLVDRDLGNVARRKMYGRAGEYRLPKHGLEYRTPSNFWLTHYILMSMTFGLAKLAVDMASCTQYEAYFEAMTKAVDIEQVRKAINGNNAKLAFKNFLALEPILVKATAHGADAYGLNPQTIPLFKHFVTRVQEKGLSYWFDTTDPIQHWTTLPEAHGNGIYMFLMGSVNTDLLKSKTVKG
jgi:hypothetical protein